MIRVARCSTSIGVVVICLTACVPERPVSNEGTSDGVAFPALNISGQGEPVDEYSAVVTMSVGGSTIPFSEPGIVVRNSYQLSARNVGDRPQFTMTFPRPWSPLRGAASNEDVQLISAGIDASNKEFRTFSGEVMSAPKQSLEGVLIVGGEAVHRAAGSVENVPSPSVPGPRFSRLVIAHHDTATVIEQLAAGASRAQNGAHSVFRRAVGPLTLETTFDHLAGTPSKVRALKGGRVASEVSFTYSDVEGAKVLTEERTVVYDESGKIVRRLTRQYNDITHRRATGGGE